MGLLISKSHVDNNPEQTVELGNSIKTEQSQNQEPEPCPGTKQSQNQEARPCLRTDQPQIQGPEQTLETGRLYLEHRVTLHKAALQGNWKRAKKSIEKCPTLSNTPITEGGETALHLAAAGGHLHFVKQLLGKMEDSCLQIRNEIGQTALCYAAIGGHARIAEQMLEKNGNLIRSEGYRPLFYAAWQGNKNMAEYLFKKSIQTAVGESVSQSGPEEDRTAVAESISHSQPDDQIGESVSHSEISSSHSQPEENQTAVGESIFQSLPEKDLIGDYVPQSQPVEDQIDHIAVGESVSHSWPEGDQILVEETASHSRPEEEQIAVEKSVFHSWAEEDQLDVLFKCIHSGLYDLAVKIVKENEDLAVANDDGETPLLALAKKSLAFRSTSLQRRWRNIACTILSYFKCEASYDDAYKLFDTLWNEAIRREDVETPFGERFKELLFTAAECENDGFLIELIRRCPDFLYKYNPSEQTIFHIAVLHRSVDIFNLSYELQGVKDILISFIDIVDGNNILHLAAQLPHQNHLNTIPGTALQMQREVLWYKEVEKLVPPNYIMMKNNNGKTPGEIFSAEHEKLMKEAEKQIKQVAKACMLVTTIITTIVFTTAFTAPGGYNDQGAPTLQHKKLFIVLPISQAISTLASLFSMLMFLSVLSSRFSENDFLKSLPLWLVVGVVSLFLSIVAMMVAFCRCFFFSKPGVTVMVAFLVLFAIVPIIFLILKYHLFFSIIRCTYSSTWLFRSKNRLFS